jgi:hypothetical protein
MPTTDRSATVVPPIVCDHPDDVAEVRADGNYHLFVRFFDGAMRSPVWLRACSSPILLWFRTSRKYSLPLPR